MTVRPAFQGTFTICPDKDLTCMEGLLFWTSETFADEREMTLTDRLEEDVCVVRVSETEMRVGGVAVWMGLRVVMLHDGVSSEDQGSGEREKGRRGGKGGTTGEGGATLRGQRE